MQPAARRRTYLVVGHGVDCRHDGQSGEIEVERLFDENAGERKDQENVEGAVVMEL